MLLTLCFIIVVEVMLRISNKNGGLILGKTTNGMSGKLSDSTSFGYKYIPTIVSVIYGFIWTWIEHDIKRMEPYFQLSMPRGVRAKDSLLLNYPYSYMPAVPVIAFKRR
jgi:Protein of unknown function (DUF3433)